MALASVGVFQFIGPTKRSGSQELCPTVAQLNFR